MTRAILYGAGKYANENHKRWVEMGIEPLSYADNDSSRHQSIFNGIEVMSLADARARYPDAKIYLAVSPVNYLAVKDFLNAHGVVDDDISVPENYELRLGCRSIWGLCHIEGDKFETCNLPQGVRIQSCGDIVKDLEHLYSFCVSLDNAIKAGEKTTCYGCSSLVKDYFPNELTGVPFLIFSDGYKGVRCNLNCIYCSRAEFLPDSERSGYSLLEVLKQLASKFSDTEVKINFSAGEFTINDEADDILEFLIDKPWKSSYHINGTGYKERFATLSKLDKISGINVSLDSGTSETYSMIKGANRFDEVVRNLEWLSKAEVPLILKYIVLPGINDNEVDVNGLVSIAGRLNAQIQITNNYLEAYKKLPEESVRIIEFMLEECRKKGIVCQVVGRVFHKLDENILCPVNAF